MLEEDNPKRRFYAVNYAEDNAPTPANGKLIPYKKNALAKPVKKELAVRNNKIDHYAGLVLVPLAAFLFIFTASILGASTYASLNTAALPSVSVVNPFTSEVKPLHYGVQVALNQPNFFAETRDAFIDEGLTFVEVDLSAMQLRYFKDGVLLEAMQIKAKGEEGTWWQTPSGLYATLNKDKSYYSKVGYVNLPWTISFQENFFIHGWPSYADSNPVPEDYAGGGIRLKTEDAERLYELVDIDTPILVHELPAVTEDFVYEPVAPELKTPHYLLADVMNSTILAARDIDTVAPIASLTKLMTVLVAAEFINLDNSVSIGQPSFVSSLIPRLGERSKVSMYSLMQLLLVESSNEAAEVIAAELGREEFIALMNEKAAALGMKDTHFVDPSGLGAENISSIRDLLLLAQYIYENRSFILELTANQNIKTNYVGGEFGELVNFNQVEDLDNFVGGKVGETIAAGQTSLTLHKISVRGSERVLAIIILGSVSRNEDVTTLYRYAEERFAR